MYIYILIFIIGAVVGSFLNVCIYRLPRGESIVFPASHCPHCNTTLGYVDLIPVIGFLLLRGVCRTCQQKISWRYPLVEILTGLFFVALALVFPWGQVPIVLGFYFIFVVLLLVVFFIDLEHQVIPDVVIGIGIVGGLLLNLLKGQTFIISALLGLLLGYLVLWLIAKIGGAVFKKEAMGDGDPYLAAMLGAWLGWQSVLLVIFLAYLIGAGVLIIPLLLGKLKLGQAVPFGPLLVAGGLLALFYGPQIINWYLSLLL